MSTLNQLLQECTFTTVMGQEIQENGCALNTSKKNNIFSPAFCPKIWSKKRDIKIILEEIRVITFSFLDYLTLVFIPKKTHFMQS